MSRGNRAGCRGGASSGLRAVANALGIARHEMSSYTKVILESQPTYPPVSQMVLPLEITDELLYMAELRQELLSRFHESSFYFDIKERNSEFRRYTDKYREIEREELRPDWSRLPDELCWKKKVGEPIKKKRKVMDKGTDEVVEKLSKLEENEKLGSPEIETQETIDENDEESEKEGQNNENEEQEILSDDDYQEEDNDYIHSYFDNGENYGDVGSDDNLDEDNAF
uniref:DNA-directed RNA polymerase III subunit n=1 Tax=Elaeophora elaphi TaxID=1147741 RepID=A0A0R3RIR9_9BILA